MVKVYVGGISPEGEQILNKYIQKFIPEAIVEPLKPVGIKGKLKNYASRPDVMLVVIDEALWQACVGVVDDVLRLEKVHKYTTDDELNQFLIKWFGSLDSTAPAKHIEIPVEPTPIVTREPVRTNDAQIEELKSKLAQSELLVRNLTAQLKDDSDVSAFVDRIKELEGELSKKDSELQKLAGSSQGADQDQLDRFKNEVTSLKTQLNLAREDSSALTYQAKCLESEKAELRKQLDEALDNSIKLEETKKKLEETTSSLEEMTKRCSELETSSADAGVLRERLEEANQLSATLEELRKELAEKDSAVNSLKVDNSTALSKIASLSESVRDLHNVLSDKEEELKSKEAELNSLQTESVSNKSMLSSYTDRINSLQASIEALNEQLSASEARVQELESVKAEYGDKLQSGADSIEVKDSEIASLNQTIEGLRGTIKSLQTTVENLKTDIVMKEGEASAYKQRCDMSQTAYDKAREDIEQLSSSNYELTQKLTSVNEEYSAVADELERLKQTSSGEKTNLSDTIVELNAKLEESESLRKKLESEINRLRDSLVSVKADSETIEQLNGELLDEKRKNARLTSELQVFKSSDTLVTATESIAEITRLKNRIEELENEPKEVGVDPALEEENRVLRGQVQSLQAEISERDEIVSELEDGIFGQMANIALPKLAYDVSLVVPDKLTSRFSVVASGSTESNMTLYQALKKSCIMQKNIRYLVVDLVTDTSIDVAFGVRSISNPVKWLIGSENFRNFIAKTSVPNVEVLSIALAYINDLSLLQVDWVKRLEELQGYADCVILNVGCLTNFISKIMFYSFSRIMPGNIILKATPVNLRTAILVLTGFKTLQNTTVSCFGYDNNSKPLYQKLTEKCQSQLMSKDDYVRF